jgi:hypothetical protein
MNWSPKVRDAVWVAIISAAVTLPFLDKPFHIDDTLMLLLAGNVVENPLDPYAGSVDWHGVPESHLTTETSPPLWNYYLAPFLSGWGASEVALHAAMLPFFVLLAAATLWLARRFSGAPWWVLLFVMASPGVVVSGNVMRDIPASALFAAALAATVAGTDRRDSRRLLLGGLLAGMAILTKYSAAVLIPLIALYPVLRRRPRLAAWCVVPIAIVALWNLLSQLVYGEPHLLSVMKFSDRFSDDWTLNLVRAFPVLGSLVYLSPLLLLHAFARRDWIAAAGAPVPGLAASLAQLGLQDSLDLQFVFWSLMGGVLLWVLMVAGIRAGIAWLEYAGDDEASDSLFLVAWACAPLFFSVIFPSFQAVRHLLPALPALVLLGIRYLEIDGASPPLRKAFVAPILALQAAMAFLGRERRAALGGGSRGHRIRGPLGLALLRRARGTGQGSRGRTLAGASRADCRTAQREPGADLPRAARSARTFLEAVRGPLPGKDSGPDDEPEWSRLLWPSSKAVAATQPSLSAVSEGAARGLRRVPGARFGLNGVTMGADLRAGGRTP